MPEVLLGLLFAALVMMLFTPVLVVIGLLGALARLLRRLATHAGF